MSEFKTSETKTHPPKSGIYNINTFGLNIVHTPEAFMDKVVLGTYAFNAVIRNGYGRPLGPNGEYQGIDRDRLRTDLSAGDFLRGVGAKSMKKIKELLDNSDEK